MKYKNQANELFVDPVLDNHEGLILLTDEEFDLQLAINNAPKEIEKQEAKDSIDIAAGRSRERFIAKGSNIADEYGLAIEQTKAWRLAGSPVNDVPLSIKDWAAATGITDEQAAAGIESAAAKMENMLLSIRKIRLEGKAAVDAVASGNRETAQAYIDQLNAITP